MNDDILSSGADPARPAWNKGKLTGPKPPLRPGHVWLIRAKLQLEKRTRDLAFFNLAIDSKLRGCDLVVLGVDDVAPNGYAVDRASVRQSKTGRPVRFELTETTRQSLDDYLRVSGRSPGQYLFPGRRGPEAEVPGAVLLCASARTGHCSFSYPPCAVTRARTRAGAYWFRNSTPAPRGRPSSASYLRATRRSTEPALRARGASPPSSPVQLRSAVWTGDARDTRPNPDLRDLRAVQYARLQQRNRGPPMAEASRHDAWQAGDRYEAYMGRWSRQVAPRFLEWLHLPRGLDWLDVGCGTGALSAAILARCNPKSLISIDPSEGFVATARARVPDPLAEFKVGDAQALALEAASRDVVASALVLNFVPERQKALGEMKRVARPGGTVGFYVWDYPGGGVEFMQTFWNAATSLDAGAVELAEDRRFPFCTPDGLADFMRGAGLTRVDCTAIEVPTVFRDFEDYWQPFTLGAGPAPGYCASLDAEARQRLKERLGGSLPRQADGSIALKARAWSLKAVVA